MNGFGLVQVLSELGGAGAVILVVCVFLKFMRREREEHAKDRAEFVSMITNHLSDEQKSRAELTLVLHELKTTIVALVARLDHDR